MFYPPRTIIKEKGAANTKPSQKGRGEKKGKLPIGPISQGPLSTPRGEKKKEKEAASSTPGDQRSEGGEEKGCAALPDHLKKRLFLGKTA